MHQPNLYNKPASKINRNRQQQPRTRRVLWWLPRTIPRTTIIIASSIGPSSSGTTIASAAYSLSSLLLLLLLTTTLSCSAFPSFFIPPIHHRASFRLLHNKNQIRSTNNMVAGGGKNNNNDNTISDNNNSTATDDVDVVAVVGGKKGSTSSPAESTTTATTKKFVYGKGDVLFGCIEEQQGDLDFGNVLDAGTGLHSIRWICTLASKGMISFTAITADKSMQVSVQNEINHLSSRIDGEDDNISNNSMGDVLIGNWFPSSENINDNSNRRLPLDIQLKDRIYDTIIADYLIGAMDGFSPYHQDEMIPKLVRFLRPGGGRMYIVGLQPIPDAAPSSGGGDANIICTVRKVRDACILLAGQRCYREYPVEWIIRQCELMNTNTNTNVQLEIKHVQRFPILYKYETIVKQINVGRSKLQYFASRELASSMSTVLNDLEKQCAAATRGGKRIQLGFDYIVCLERK